MIDINDYFDPVSIEKPRYEYLSQSAGFSHNLEIHTDNKAITFPGNYNITIIGVPEERNSPNVGCERGPEAIRQRLYMLSRVPGKTKIADFGNMKKGKSFDDTIAGLCDILCLLANENIISVIIGGSSALTLAIDKFFAARTQPYTLATIDSRIDFQPGRGGNDSFSYLNNIIYSDKSYVNHFVNIGYQTYLNDPQTINWLQKRKSDLMRVGDVRGYISLTEPLLRDSDAALIDIASVRQADAPGTMFPSPNGFYGEEICLLARYAGISESVRVFGIFEVNPSVDRGFQTSDIAAQIIWFFLEGFGQRQYESAMLDDQSTGRFTRYHVQISGIDEELIFVKSNLTERWWMEINNGTGQVKHIACSHEDYLLANRNEVPDRWIKAIARMNR
ncbi:MAG: arginase family protein [Bacteroidales bacterium]|nr:arginase family protein [Bacteroidales bacterium]